MSSIEPCFHITITFHEGVHLQSNKDTIILLIAIWVINIEEIVLVPPTVQTIISPKNIRFSKFIALMRERFESAIQKLIQD